MKWLEKLLAKWGTKLFTKKLDKMASKKNSNNTTVVGIAGVVTILAAAAKAWFDGDPETVVNFGILIPSLITSIGLIFAKDSDATHSDNPTK